MSTLLVPGIVLGKRRRIAWAEWGPAGSRLLPAPNTHTSVWVCYVYGMTFALSLRTRSQKEVLVFGFNQLAVRRGVAEAAAAA